jgi:hypothetical protein
MMEEDKVLNDCLGKYLDREFADHFGKYLDRRVFAQAGNGIRGFGKTLSKMALTEQICDVQFIESNFFVKKMEIVVRSSWKERLWSWTWKPWVAEKSQIVYVPDPKLYRIGKTIMGHPTTIAKLIRELMDDACK